MPTFRVWAPRASRVELVLEDAVRLPMTAEQGGHFAVSVTDAGPGTRYAFSLDGGAPRPDPRSAAQPDGVHGMSMWVDHGAYRWHDAGHVARPLAGSVLYELHVGTFTPGGTFDAAIERLPHLVGLGIDAVELMPVAAFAGTRGWGYDGVCPFAPHAAYGGPEGLKRLVDACHAEGIAVIVDVVYNHLGPEGNYLPEFGPYLRAGAATPWGRGVNFDGPGSDEVRRFVVDNACMWLRDYHLDGLRLDAVHAIHDRSAEHVLSELSREVRALEAELRRPLWLIAETPRNSPELIRCPEAGGHGLHALWTDDWHHALHAMLTGETVGYYQDFDGLGDLARALAQPWIFEGQMSRYRGRAHGAAATGVRGDQVIVGIQNHDQVGNRPAGERLGALTSPGRLLVAAALLLTGPFVPMLFQGEEWAAETPFPFFCDLDRPGLGAAVRDGRRRELREFGFQFDAMPDPQAESTFAAAKLRWEARDRAPHADVLAWYRKLIALRRSYPALRDPRFSHVSVRHDASEGWLWVVRGPFGVAANLGECPVRLSLQPGGRLVVASDAAVRLEGTRLTLPPDAVAIVDSEGRGEGPPA